MWRALAAAGSSFSSGWWCPWPRLLRRKLDKVIRFLSLDLKFYTVLLTVPCNYSNSCQMSVSVSTLEWIYGQKLWILYARMMTYFDTYTECFSENRILKFRLYFHWVHIIRYHLWSRLLPPQISDRSRSLPWLGPVQIKSQWTKPDTNVHVVRGSGLPQRTNQSYRISDCPPPPSTGEPWPDGLSSPGSGLWNAGFCYRAPSVLSMAPACLVVIVLGCWWSPKSTASA